MERATGGYHPHSFCRDIASEKGSGQWPSNAYRPSCKQDQARTSPAPALDQFQMAITTSNGAGTSHSTMCMWKNCRLDLLHVSRGTDSPLTDRTTSSTRVHSTRLLSLILQKKFSSRPIFLHTNKHTSASLLHLKAEQIPIPSRTGIVHYQNHYQCLMHGLEILTSCDLHAR